MDQYEDLKHMLDTKFVPARVTQRDSDLEVTRVALSNMQKELEDMIVVISGISEMISLYEGKPPYRPL